MTFLAFLNATKGIKWIGQMDWTNGLEVNLNI